VLEEEEKLDPSGKGEGMTCSCELS